MNADCCGASCQYEDTLCEGDVKVVDEVLGESGDYYWLHACLIHRIMYAQFVPQHSDPEFRAWSDYTWKHAATSSECWACGCTKHALTCHCSCGNVWGGDSRDWVQQFPNCLIHNE